MRTIRMLRWVAVLGQSVTVTVAWAFLNFTLPLLPIGITIAALAVMTLLSQRGRQSQLNNLQSSFHFAFDIVQLSILLFLTGGLTNPFAVLILAPVTVAAAILTFRSVLLLGLLAIVCIVILAFIYIELPWLDKVQLSPLFITGSATALVLADIFILLYVYRVANEARRLSGALNIAETSLERSRQLASLGALAAAAAHELGSPLGTIVIAAKELARSIAQSHPSRKDADLLVKESQRCRDILAELSTRPEKKAGDHRFQPMPVAALIKLAAGAHQSPAIQLEIDAPPSSLQLPPQPEILHGLGNLLQNAFDAATHTVTVSVRDEAKTLVIIIEDDGVGFPVELLPRLGEPYLTTSSTKENHMGLGIFIAQHLIELGGGRITFTNRPEGGARVEVSWPKDLLNHVSIPVVGRR